MTPPYLYAYRHDMRSAAERSVDTGSAQRAVNRPLRVRRLEANGKTYAAYDAHALLEWTDPSHLARPGHPIG